MNLLHGTFILATTFPTIMMTGNIGTWLVGGGGRLLGGGRDFNNFDLCKPNHDEKNCFCVFVVAGESERYDNNSFYLFVGIVVRAFVWYLFVLPFC